MPLIVKDRVRENSATSGTGTITLTGAVLGFQTFSSAIGNTNTTYYAITESGTANWEVGLGTVGAGTLTRDTVLESSNGGAKVNFGSAAKDVFCTYPAEKSIYFDGSNNVGIGTSSPTGILDVQGTTASVLTRSYSTAPTVPQSAVQIGLGGSAAGQAGVGPSFLFFHNNSSSAKTFLGRLTAVFENATAGSESGALIFQVRANSADTTANTEVMRVTSTQNVGIGTSSPTEKLDVIGNIKASQVTASGTVNGSELLASNGLVLNSNTVSANYTIPTNYNAVSTGAITINSGVTVTVPSGSNWKVL